MREIRQRKIGPQDFPTIENTESLLAQKNWGNVKLRGKNENCEKCGKENQKNDYATQKTSKNVAKSGPRSFPAPSTIT